MRHLNPQQLITNLNLGKPIEQWLGHINQEDFTMLKWLTIYKESENEYSVDYMEVLDEGNENFLDIYEFSVVDPDEPYGIMTKFKSAEEALDYSIKKYNCSIGRFVNSGVLQEEYKDYLNQKK